MNVNTKPYSRCLAFLSMMSVTLHGGCGPKDPVKPVMSWRFEARQAAQEVRVLPTVLLTPISTNLDPTTWVGTALSDEREDLRRQRVASLQAIPSTLGWTLPSAIHEALEGNYEGDFHVGSWPVGTKDRTARKLMTGEDIDPWLASIAREGKGTGTLFTWVYWVKGKPMTAMGPPGDMVDGPSGPFVLRFEEEPYQVEVRMGAALVAKDGEVIFRLIEQPSAVLGERGVEQTSWELARTVASELEKVWLVENP